MISISAIRSTAIATAKYKNINRILPAYRAYSTKKEEGQEPKKTEEGKESKKEHEVKPEVKEEPKEETKVEKQTSEEAKVEAQAAKETKVETQIPEEIKNLLLEKDKKISELQNAYLRSLADQENIRDRSRKELETTKEYAIQKFAKDLLDTVDILNMALTAVPTELREKETAEKSDIAKDPSKLLDQLTNLYMGVSMTESELMKTLKRHGVERFNPEGEPFDHNKHQALFQSPVPDKTPGTVFAVQKMGYTLKGRVLRPAHVGVVAEPQ